MCERLDSSALLAESAMPVLEAIGGAGAIVGIADVSLRAVSEIYTIIQEARDVPETRTNALTKLLTLRDTLKSVRDMLHREETGTKRGPMTAEYQSSKDSLRRALQRSEKTLLRLAAQTQTLFGMEASPLHIALRSRRSSSLTKLEEMVDRHQSALMIQLVCFYVSVIMTRQHLIFKS